VKQNLHIFVTVLRIGKSTYEVSRSPFNSSMLAISSKITSHGATSVFHVYKMQARASGAFRLSNINSVRVYKYDVQIKGMQQHSGENYIMRFVISTLYVKAKAVPLHVTKALGWRGRIAPTHSQPRH
jgi:hypothetical protein